jgi:DNA-binding CsgD family transcriptional regulator
MRKCGAGVPYDAGMHFFRRHDKGRLPHQDVLTPAEWRVLEHVRQRRTNAEIAVRLGVSVNTVRTHVSSMLAKLEVHDREELARWNGEPAPVTRIALERRRVPFGAGVLSWLRDDWTRLGRAARVIGAAGVAGLIAVVVFVAAGASLAPDDGGAPLPHARASELSPTPTPAPVAEWTVGAPVAWPDGITLVLGTGCYQCGGQHSTFELVTEDDRVQLPKAVGEEHLSILADDPDHLYLATCTSADCNPAGPPIDPETTLFESFDRGQTWTEVERAPSLWTFLGRLDDGDVLRSHYEPQPGRWDRFPSGAPLLPQATAGSFAFPRVIDGQIVWWNEGRLLDEAGDIVRDLRSVIPRDAEVWDVVDGPGDAMALVWRIDRITGVTALAGTSVRTYAAPYLHVEQFRWLDSDRLIASVGYPLGFPTATPTAALGGISNSRIPTLIDLRTGTLQPLERFLDPGDPAVAGRNDIEAVWQD